MLSPEGWQRLRALFDSAIALPAGEQEAFARAQASDDPELLDELLSMLDSRDGATRRLVAPMRLAAEAMAPEDAPELPAGTRFGPWATRSLLGAGGMGQVYLGCRADGAYEREVAIKVMNAGALDVQHRVLFDHECRLLARMEHPAIAHIHDAGTGDDGRPYLVMEYIRGEPIDRWCDQRALSMRARVELLATVCEGVLHAHQKGVIHRDLKPSNVLVSEVDGQALPTIIDFGIATHSADAAAATGSGGTPGYASPEQLGSHGDVDVRTDVYSLGALLYTLACGTVPSRDERGPPRAPSQVLRELPRAELAARASARGTTPRRLLRELADGLDAVALKALQAEREGRYQSASELVADLGRWRAHYRPRALEGGRLIGLRKLLHRNRLAFGAGSVVVVALVAALVMVSWSLGEARREAERSRITADFLASVLDSVDPAVAQDMDTALMVRVLDEAAARAATELDGYPAIRADVELLVAINLIDLGEYERAVTHLEIIEALAAEHPRALAYQRLRAAQVMSDPLVTLDRIAEARSALERGIELSRNAPRENRWIHFDMQSRLSWVMVVEGDDEAALEAARSAHESLQGLLPEDDASRLDAARRHAEILSMHGRHDEAAALLDDVVAIRTRAEGANHPATLVSRRDRAVVKLRKRDFAGVEPELRRLVSVYTRLYGPDNAYTMAAQGMLASSLRQQGKVAEAGPYYRRAMEWNAERFGPESLNALVMRHNYANWLLSDGQAREAASEQAILLGIVRRLFGDTHQLTRHVLKGLAEAQLALGDTTEARRNALASLEATREATGGSEAALRDARETLEKIDAALAGASPD